MDIERLCLNCMNELREGETKCSRCGHDPEAETEPNTHALEPYTILQGKYLVGNVIGEGGFGITYIGFDLNLEVKIAIKEFYPNGFVTRESGVTSMVTNYTTANADQYSKWRGDFVNEARRLAKFSNLPGIVHVRDFFQENNTAYIVMGYVEGETLKSYLKSHGGKIPTQEALKMVRPVIKALAEVHGAGIVHRDISPDNIMVTGDGSVRLIDFGAARDFGSEGEKSLSVLLKPGYAPEEQYRSKGNQGPWTDVYAMCATIYRCITGTKPAESMERMRKDELKRPSSLGVSIDPDTESALMSGMAVYAEDRIKTMGELEIKLYPTDAVTNASTSPEKGISPDSSNKTADKKKTFTLKGREGYILAGAIAGLIIILVIAAIQVMKKPDPPVSEEVWERIDEPVSENPAVEPVEDNEIIQLEPEESDVSDVPEGYTESDDIEEEPEEDLYDDEDSEQDEYIVYGSDTTYFSKDYFEELSDEELRLARNEIYARHGRMFRDQELQAYFNSKSWYEPTFRPDEFDTIQTAILNDYEIANRDLIVEVENERK